MSSQEWTHFKNGSGKVPNSLKTFFLGSAAASVREVKGKRDNEKLLYTRDAMVRCGLPSNINGVLGEKRLFSHVQELIKKYRENLYDTPVADSIGLDGEVMDSRY